MNTNDPQLALGTAQFGLAYGIAGNSKLPSNRDVQVILDHAWDAGVRVLDTAPAYGDIETRLRACCSTHHFKVVSKISALPESLCSQPAEFVTKSIETSMRRLGDHLETLLFHNAMDLLGDAGEEVWNAAQSATRGYGINLGVSCYSPAEAQQVRELFEVKICQIPGNAFDQRLVQTGLGADGLCTEIHLRSVFLQGLLLLNQQHAEERVPVSRSAMQTWISWCKKNNFTPVDAALSAAKSLPGVAFCVVGVDNLHQFSELAAAWLRAGPTQISELACDNRQVIDPRCW